MASNQIPKTEYYIRLSLLQFTVALMHRQTDERRIGAPLALPENPCRRVTVRFGSFQHSLAAEHFSCRFLGELSRSASDSFMAYLPTANRKRREVEKNKTTLETL